jgi:N-acetylneuraminate synthase
MIKIIKKIFDKKFPPVLVAEISANHNGSFENAKKLIFTAKKYGADIVKLQTYEPKNMTINISKKDFIIKKGLWKNYKLWDLYKKAQTPFAWQKKLFAYAKKIGIPCFSTPYDDEGVDLLEKIKSPIYKISSFEMNDISLVERICKTKKPIIISTGLALMKDIEKIYKVLKNVMTHFKYLFCVVIQSCIIFFATSNLFS